MIIGMDQENINVLRDYYNNDPAGKISRLLDHTAHPRDIADPWYTRKFDVAWRDIYEGCTALFDELTAHE